MHQLCLSIFHVILYPSNRSFPLILTLSALQCKTKIFQTYQTSFKGDILVNIVAFEDQSIIT